LNLVKQDVLYRIQGKGTFVSKEIKNIKTFQLSGSIGDISPDGLKMQEVKVLDITKATASKKLQNLFNIDESEQVVRVRRTRSAETIPVSYIVNYLPLEFGTKIRKKDLNRYPMLRILRDKCRIPITSGIQHIEAVASDSDTASALSISIFSPVLYIETTIFDEKERPVEFVQTFIRPDRYKYSVKLIVEKGPQNEIRIKRN
jgi:GntR family transcriptional regulator